MLNLEGRIRRLRKLLPDGRTVCMATLWSEAMTLLAHRRGQPVRPTQIPPPQERRMVTVDEADEILATAQGRLEQAAGDKERRELLRQSYGGSDANWTALGLAAEQAVSSRTGSVYSRSDVLDEIEARLGSVR